MHIDRDTRSPVSSPVPSGNVLIPLIESEVRGTLTVRLAKAWIGRRIGTLLNGALADPAAEVRLEDHCMLPASDGMSFRDIDHIGSERCPRFGIILCSEWISRCGGAERIALDVTVRNVMY